MSHDRVDKHIEKPHERVGGERPLSERLPHNQKVNTPETLAQASVYLDNLKLLFNSDGDMSKAMTDNLAKAIASSLRTGGEPFGPAMRDAFERYAYTTMPNMLTFNVSEQVATKQFEDRLNKLLTGSPYKCHFSCEIFEASHGLTAKHLVLSVKNGSKSVPGQLQATFDTER